MGVGGILTASKEKSEISPNPMRIIHSSWYTMVSGELAEIMAHDDDSTVPHPQGGQQDAPKETETSPVKTPGEGRSQMTTEMLHAKRRARRVRRNTGCGAGQTWLPIPALAPTSRMTLTNTSVSLSLSLSEL